MNVPQAKKAIANPDVPEDLINGYGWNTIAYQPNDEVVSHGRYTDKHGLL